MNEVIREMGAVTTFGGQCPVVPTAPYVDVEALTEGDDDPMFVTLQIAEVGQLSRNGLLQDEALVEAVQQSAIGLDGLVGHLDDAARETAFPISDTHPTPYGGLWVGVLREGAKLWGKAYIPPGSFRNHVKRLKAAKGRLAVSIYGHGVYQAVREGVRRLTKLTLESIDFVPHTRAALPLGGEFAVTAEIGKDDNQTDAGQEDTMVEQVVREQVIATLQPGDIPQVVRESIIRQAQVQADAERVAEMRQANEALEQRVAEMTQQQSALEEQVSEMRQYATVVGELRQTLGEDADVVSVVTDMHTSLTALAEQLGVGMSDISIRVQEMHEQTEAMAQAQFERDVADAVTELTANWHLTNDAQRNQVEALHNQVRRVVVAELGDNRDSDVIRETATRLWQDEFKPLAEALRNSMAGPGAIVGGKQVAKTEKTEEELLRMGQRYGRK